MTRTRLVPGLVLALAALVVAPATAATKNGADLVSKSVRGRPIKFTGGTRFTVKIKIRNNGNRKAGKSTVALYIGKHARFAKSDLKIGTAHVPALRVHKSKTVKVKAKLPNVKASARSLKQGSYHLIACVNANHKVKERNRKNDCRAEKGSVPLRLAAPPSGGNSPPPPVAAPTFVVSDGFDWGFGNDASNHTVVNGDPVPVSLEAGNGFAGQAGYTRAQVTSQPVPLGTNTTLAPAEKDDGTVQVQLPFTFSFAGLPYTSVSVGTNGWLGFGEPAWDYFDDYQTSDFRGTDQVIGQFVRGLMPYWVDLDLTPGAVTDSAITETVAPGNASVSFTWHSGQCCTGKAPVRNFSVTLFPNGSFRYDYGANVAGGNQGFVGYSTGTGTLDKLVAGTTSVPTTGLLYTPKPLPAVATLAAGTMTMTLPRGTTTSSLDPGCSVTKAATALADGAVSCSVPALGPGQVVTRHLTFGETADEEGTFAPTRDYSGTYAPAGGTPLADNEELSGTTNFPANMGMKETVAYTGSPPVAGTPTTFTVIPGGDAGSLFNPSVVITLPTGSTFDSVKVSGNADDYPGCLAPVGGKVTCELPSIGTGGFKTLVVTVTPSLTEVGNPITLTTAEHADNGGTDAGGTATSADPVAPPA